jgi:hypothetical protein
VYAVLSMGDTLETLGDSLHKEFVLISGCPEVRHEFCEQACLALSNEPDVGCCVSWSGANCYTSWDVGEAVRVDALLCRTFAVRGLLERGFRPLVGLAEWSTALRHAGWRVQMLGESLTLGTTDHHTFFAGRQQFARELYDQATEQLLAQGPRVLKRTVLYSVWRAWKRWSEGSPWQTEAGYLGQSVWSALRGDRSRLARARWRQAALPFHFPEPHPENDTVVLLFTAFRPWYLRRALRALHQHWPIEKPLKLVVSQDGEERTTASMIGSLKPQVGHYQFREKVSLPWAAWRKGQAPYYRIAQHFGSSITRAFRESSVQRVVVLEDDIEIGADFFGYMNRFAPLLDSSSDLLAVSAWNDNAGYASCPETVHRTDCFPGQGWMITKEAWKSLEPDWPDTLWDEWMRRPEVCKGRHFIRPELNRVRNFGRAGTGSSKFFDRYIAPLRWLDEAHDPEEVSGELSVHEYRDRLWTQVAKAQLIEHPDELGQADAVMLYEDRKDFARVAGLLGILPRYHKRGPRAAFDGVVILRVRGVQLFLVRRDTLTRVSLEG